MRHRKLKGKLNRKPAHRKALLENLMLSLLKYERIQTTTAKAKQLKRFADPIIELGKRTDLHAKRLARKTVRQKDAFEKLFGVYGPRFLKRSGGYTRIFNLGNRHGDGAPVSLIEILPDPSKENEPRISKAKKPKTDEEKEKFEAKKQETKAARKKNKHLVKQEAKAKQEGKKAKSHSKKAPTRKTDTGTGRAKTSKKGLS